MIGGRFAVFGQQGLRLLLDALLPPLCLSCSALVDRPGRLCPDCWKKVDFLSGACCRSCGLPFELPLDEELLCGACLRRRPAFERARAVMRYDDACRRLILGFKHGDRTEAAGAFADWLVRAGGPLLAEADLLVPVPLHPWRLLRRRYNQAALLAQAVGRRAGLPVSVDLLVRRRPTPSQGGLSFRQRRQNVRGAFAVRAGRAGLLPGRRVLLIDDVLTTGATAEACARALLAGGAGAVDVLALARVVRPIANPI